MTTNETYGITAEACLAEVYGIPHNIAELKRTRIDNEIKETMRLEFEKFRAENPEIVIESSEGFMNGKVDFRVVGNKTLSLKTLQKKGGKICPQGGQPTYKSFHNERNFPECPIPPAELSRGESNSLRFNWMKDHIELYLKRMYDNTFCCDYLVLMNNCKTKPSTEILMKKQIDFSNISFTKDTYEEKVDEKRKGGRCEFSSEPLMKLENGTIVKIGEIQFHFKHEARGRDVIKFRFHKKFLQNI